MNERTNCIIRLVNDGEFTPQQLEAQGGFCWDDCTVQQEELAVAAKQKFGDNYEIIQVGGCVNSALLIAADTANGVGSAVSQENSEMYFDSAETITPREFFGQHGLHDGYFEQQMLHWIMPDGTVQSPMQEDGETVDGVYRLKD